MLRTTHRRITGFTIIEMMVALAVLAVLVLVAAPSFSDLVTGSRVRTATSEVHTTLIFARSEAIKRAMAVDIVPAAGGWSNGWQVMAGAEVLRVQQAFDGLSIECPAGTNCTSTISYRRNGRLANGRVEMVVNQDPAASPPRISRRCIDVDLSGKPHISVDRNKDGNCTSQ
jgi:type IV fimbrial biogenesis protein FimT